MKLFSGDGKLDKNLAGGLGKTMGKPGKTLGKLFEDTLRPETRALSPGKHNVCGFTL